MVNLFFGDTSIGNQGYFCTWKCVEEVNNIIIIRRLQVQSGKGCPSDIRNGWPIWAHAAPLPCYMVDGLVSGFIQLDNHSNTQEDLIAPGTPSDNNILEAQMSIPLELILRSVECKRSLDLFLHRTFPKAQPAGGIVRLGYRFSIK